MSHVQEPSKTSRNKIFYFYLYLHSIGEILNRSDIDL